MPKNRRVSQRKREKKKNNLWKPAPDMLNRFGFRDFTPLNAARKDKGLTDRHGGGYLLG